MSDAVKILIADDEQECIDFVRDSLADIPYEPIQPIVLKQTVRRLLKNSGAAE